MSFTVSYMDIYNPVKDQDIITMRVQCKNCKVINVVSANVLNTIKCRTCGKHFPVNVCMLPGFLGIRLLYYNKGKIGGPK